MDKRLGQLAGLLAFVMVILRLNRLIESGPENPRWKMILVAAAVLGAVVWWLLRQLVSNRIVSWSLFTLGGLILFLRIANPETLSGGFLPTSETPNALFGTMEEAIRYIRNGVPPIDPVVGVTAILAALMWVVGALFVWGSNKGPVAALFLPSTILYLQFAVFDRSYAGLGWMTASALLLTLAIVALAMERRTDAGRARDGEGRPLPRRSPTLAVLIGSVLAVVAVAATTSASGLVSEYGNLPWRSGAGYGLGGGGLRYDRFVDLQQQLVNQSDVLLFQATTDGVPPDIRMYWRMETLDEFDGVAWKRSSTTTRDYEPGLPIGDASHTYRGETAEILQFVQIDALRGPLAPTAGVPTEIHARDLEDAIQPRSFDVLGDSALVYTPELYEGDQYQVLSSYPLSEADLGALATQPDGELSPIFANAAAAGEFDAEASLPVISNEPPPDLDFYTRLPEGRPSDLAGQAFLRTQGATTDFEKAWMLEAWFRSDAFIYDSEVSTGHSALNLADWLADSTSPNYRRGYCEQFAAAMAVLGRELGIPSRVVWGFTPGTTADQDGVSVIQVRGTNAHAWVEMWMDPVGWVKFDPTPRGTFVEPTAAFDPTGFIPEDEASSAASNSNIPLPEPGFDFLDLEPTEFAPVQRVNWWLILVPVLLLLGLAIPLSKTVRRRRRLARIRAGGDITAAWDEIVDRLTDLGRPVSPSSTPMEVAEGTNPALVPIAVTYSAAVYGGREGAAKESDLMAVELWLHERFDAADRMKAALSPRSLLRRQEPAARSSSVTSSSTRRSIVRN